MNAEFTPTSYVLHHEGGVAEVQHIADGESGFLMMTRPGWVCVLRPHPLLVGLMSTIVRRRTFDTREQAEEWGAASLSVFGDALKTLATMRQMLIKADLIEVHEVTT